MDFLSKGEVLTNTDLDRFDRNRPIVYIEKVLDLWVQLMKNGGKNKSVAFIILVSVVCWCFSEWEILTMRVVTLSLMACMQQLFGAVGCEMRSHLFETKLGQT